MTNATLNKTDLRKFTGSENWYRHGLAQSVLYTEGAKHVADAGGAYWLLDEIACSQLKPKVKAQAFQLWRLTVQSDQTAVLACENGNGRVVYTKRLDFTDFSLDEITFYVIDNTILLPSEY